MEELYVVEYQGGDDRYGVSQEFFIASSEQNALEQFTHWAEEENIDIQNTPTAQQTYIETYQQTPDGAYGPRPRYPEENDVLFSKPTVGCCEYMATGQCGHDHHGGNSGKTVSQTGSEPAE